VWRFAKLMATWRYNCLMGQEGVEIWRLFTHVSALKHAAGLLCVVKRCRFAALEPVLVQVWFGLVWFGISYTVSAANPQLCPAGRLGRQPTRCRR
jgi:hypothetical protein